MIAGFFDTKSCETGVKSIAFCFYNDLCLCHQLPRRCSNYFCQISLLEIFKN